MGEMKLICRGKKQAAHVDVDRQKVGAMTTPYCHSLEQTGARNTHLYTKNNMSILANRVTQ